MGRWRQGRSYTPEHSITADHQQLLGRWNSLAGGLRYVLCSVRFTAGFWRNTGQKGDTAQQCKGLIELIIIIAQSREVLAFGAFILRVGVTRTGEASLKVSLRNPPPLNAGDLGALHHDVGDNSLRLNRTAFGREVAS